MDIRETAIAIVLGVLFALSTALTIENEVRLVGFVFGS